jgi:hypothetical protein
MGYDDKRIMPCLLALPADPSSFWNSRYAEPGFAYGTQPNDFLREQAALLPAGPGACASGGRAALRRLPDP